jgi:hypothetical protein
MIIDDILFFSPGIKFHEVEIESQENLPGQFKERIQGFYLDPIKQLNDVDHAFAAGVLLVSCIDALSRYDAVYGKLKSDQKRFSKWVQNNLPSFKDGYSSRFYCDFRNGLVHEARIKKAGSFSYEISDPFIVDEEKMIINPALLIEEVSNALKEFISNLQSDDKLWSYFNSKIKEDLEIEIDGKSVSKKVVS